LDRNGRVGGGTEDGIPEEMKLEHERLGVKELSMIDVIARSLGSTDPVFGGVNTPETASTS
jgi:hypothetical protein